MKEVTLMRKYLLPEGGNFYKANLHCHTVLSDGKKTPEEVKELYKEKGYSVVAYTDHDIMVTHDELTDDEFLALHGFEMEVNPKPTEGNPYEKTCHVCYIGIDKDNVTQPMWHKTKYRFGNAPKYEHLVKIDETEPDFEREYTPERISEMMKIGREKGFFVTYNHPTWSMENFNDYIHYDGMHAFEIMNGCLAFGWDEYNSHEYDDFLRGGKRIYCIGADDNHNYAAPDSHFFDSFHAFTMIKADNLEYNTITKALVDGNFYASEGPEITELYWENGEVHIKCSPADRIYCTFGIRRAGVIYRSLEAPVTSATFPIPEEAVYFRFTVVDERGRRAFSNGYFIDEMPKGE